MTRRTLGRLTRQRLRSRRRDQSLAAAGQLLDQHAPPGRIQLGQHVVEEEQRRLVAALLDQRRLGEQQREDRGALFALRAKRAQVARAGRDRDVVEVRPEPGCAALQVAVETRLECLRRGRLALVADYRVLEAELAGALREHGREQLERLAAPLNQFCTEPCNLLRPGRNRGAVAPLQRGVALGERGSVVRRQ